MDLTLTPKAEEKLRELLAAAGKGARVRVDLRRSGCICG